MDYIFSMIAKCEAATRRGYLGKEFDWLKAKMILTEKGVLEAHAGLMEDLSMTSGQIWKDGKPYNGSAYLHSLWATPVILLSKEDGSTEMIPCFRETKADGSWSSNWPIELL